MIEVCLQTNYIILDMVSLYMYMYMYVRLVSLGWESDSLETAVLCAPVNCESRWFSEVLLLFFPSP